MPQPAQLVVNGGFTKFLYVIESPGSKYLIRTLASNSLTLCMTPLGMAEVTTDPAVSTRFFIADSVITCFSSVLAPSQVVMSHGQNLLFITGHADGTIILWDAKSTKPLLKLSTTKSIDITQCKIYWLPGLHKLAIIAADDCGKQLWHWQVNVEQLGDEKKLACELLPCLFEPETFDSSIIHLTHLIDQETSLLYSVFLKTNGIVQFYDIANRRLMPEIKLSVSQNHLETHNYYSFTMQDGSLIIAKTYMANSIIELWQVVLRKATLIAQLDYGVKVKINTAVFYYVAKTYLMFLTIGVDDALRLYNVKIERTIATCQDATLIPGDEFNAAKAICCVNNENSLQVITAHLNGKMKLWQPVANKVNIQGAKEAQAEQIISYSNGYCLTEDRTFYRFNLESCQFDNVEFDIIDLEHCFTTIAVKHLAPEVYARLGLEQINPTVFVGKETGTIASLNQNIHLSVETDGSTGLFTKFCAVCEWGNYAYVIYSNSPYTEIRCVSAGSAQLASINFGVISKYRSPISCLIAIEPTQDGPRLIIGHENGAINKCLFQHLVFNHSLSEKFAAWWHSQKLVEQICDLDLKAGYRRITMTDPIITCTVYQHGDNELLVAGTKFGYLHFWNLETGAIYRRSLRLVERPLSIIYANDCLYVIVKGNHIVKIPNTPRSLQDLAYTQVLNSYPSTEGIRMVNPFTSVEKIVYQPMLS